MFLFFGGSRVRHKRLGEGHFHCPRCRRAQPFDLARASNWFHLYWLPVFKMQDLGEVRICRGCGLVLGPDDIETGGSTRPDRSRGHHRTVTCGACGNVNPVTESNCLRCGGEL